MAEEENQESSSPTTQSKLCCHCHLRQALPFKETICSTCSEEIKDEDSNTCLVKLEELSDQSEDLEEQETVC